MPSCDIERNDERTCRLLEAALVAEKKLGFRRDVILLEAGKVADAGDWIWLCRLAKGLANSGSLSCAWDMAGPGRGVAPGGVFKGSCAELTPPAMTRMYLPVCLVGSRT